MTSGVEYLRRNRVRPTLDGITFDSKREARRWSELLLLARAGEITELIRQYPIKLIGEKDFIRTLTGLEMIYKCDFKYYDTKLRIWVIEDAKGYPTEVYKMKKAILAAMGVQIKEV